MTWQMRDPFGEAISNAVSVGVGLNSARNSQAAQQREWARQDAEDKRAADQSTAAVNASKAETDKSSYELGREKSTDTALDNWRKTQDPSHLIDPKDPAKTVMNLQRAAAEAAFYDPTSASTLSGMARDAAMDPNRLAQTGLTNARTHETMSHANLFDAMTDRTKGWREELRLKGQNALAVAEKNGDFSLRRSAIAAGAQAARAATSIRVAELNGANSMQRAQFEAANRDALAASAENFMINERMPAQAAINAAIANVRSNNQRTVDQYNQEMQAYKQQVTANGGSDGLTQPTMAPQQTIVMPQQQQQPISVVVQTPQGPQVMMVPYGQSPGGGGGSNPFGGGGGGSNVSSIVSMARDAMKNHGVSAGQIRAKLGTMGLSEHDRNEVLRQLGPTQQPPKPHPKFVMPPINPQNPMGVPSFLNTFGR